MAEEKITADKAIEEAIIKLKALDAELETISKAKSDSLNFFDAVQMNTQEIKHSAFFAYLLSPKKPHGLGSGFLIQFLKKLIDYTNGESGFSNTEKLAKAGIKSLEDFNGLITAEDTEVYTELSAEIMGGRMDVVIESKSAKTVVVIENKVFTSTHDEQLYRYEREYERFTAYKKVFVYLTPFGSEPQEAWDKWCLLSYQEILEAVNETVKGLGKTKENKKLKIIMEDYAEMVNTDILKGNKKLLALCRQIKKKHADALEILEAYNTDNCEKIIAYCADWIKLNRPDIKIYKQTGLTIRFYSDLAHNFFKEGYGEVVTDGEQYRGDISYKSDKEGLRLDICLSKSAESEWSKAQRAIMATCAAKKKAGNRFFTLSAPFYILTNEEMQMPFEEIEEYIDDRLAQSFGWFDNTEKTYVNK